MWSWTVLEADIRSMASVHAYSAENLPFGRELFAAEEEAKTARKGVGVQLTSLVRKKLIL
jgi:hypothetical protein